MPSNYPSALDTFDTVSNGTALEDTHPAAHNAVQEAVVAIQTELGTNPSAGSATVAVRLDAIESGLSEKITSVGGDVRDSGLTRNKTIHGAFSYFEDPFYQMEKGELIMVDGQIFFDPVGGTGFDEATQLQTQIGAANTAIAGIVELATDAETQTGTDVSRAITPANLQACTATETRKGVVELATDAETQTGTDTARAITPANLQACTATETRKGVVELATNAEAVTGTDTARAVTPAGLAAKLATVPGAILQTDVFTTTGANTWTKAAGAKLVECILIGGGGGGGGSAAVNTAYGGQGGGAGALVHIVLPASALSATETVTVGAGGAGGVVAHGAAGGSTTFGSKLTAAGGIRGKTDTQSADTASNYGYDNGMLINPVGSATLGNLANGSNGRIPSNINGQTTLAPCGGGGGVRGNYNGGIGGSPFQSGGYGTAFAAIVSLSGSGLDGAPAGGTAGGASAGTNGQNGGSVGIFGQGGGGGGGSTGNVTAANGGNGGLYGGGGGGAGCNGGTGTGGNGGNGGNGVAVIIQYG